MARRKPREARPPRWWSTTVAVCGLALIAGMIVATALVADASGIEVCGRTTRCSDGEAQATMVGVALLAIVAIILVLGAFVAVTERLERRLFPQRPRTIRGRRLPRRR